MRGQKRKSAQRQSSSHSPKPKKKTKLMVNGFSPQAGTSRVLRSRTATTSKEDIEKCPKSGKVKHKAVRSDKTKTCVTEENQLNSECKPSTSSFPEECKETHSSFQSKNRGSLKNLNRFARTKSKVEKIKHEFDSKSEKIYGGCMKCEQTEKKTLKTEESIEPSNIKLDKNVPQQFSPAWPDLKPRCTQPVVLNSIPRYTSTHNMIHYLLQKTLGRACSTKLQQSIQTPVVNLVSNLHLYRTGSPFDRRVTAMEWHPTRPNLIAVGSKGGEIILWDVEQVADDMFIPGMGPGGSIQAMKFWPWDNSRLLTASIDGTVTLQDFEGRDRRIMLDTMDSHDYWYCSTDVSDKVGLLVAGDNVGNAVLMTKNREKVLSAKLHKNKITHTEFSPREDWLVCTASVDHTVKFWDVRMMKDKKSALQILQHDKAVNSAYFSLTDGCRVLTTDQHSEMRVYSAPNWHLEQTILHPHRQFQHLTQIKAFWHPLQDLAVVGRYPDPNFPGYIVGEKRTIDVFDANSGNLVCQLSDPAAGGIVSLNKFNHTGDMLASGMGVNILIWRRQEDLAQKQEALVAAMQKQGIQLNRDGIGSRSSTSRSRSSGSLKKKTDKTEGKSKSKTKNHKGDI